MNGTSPSRSVSVSRHCGSGLTRQMSLSAVVEAATGVRSDGAVVSADIRPISVRDALNYRMTAPGCVRVADVGVIRGEMVTVSDRMRWKANDVADSIDRTHLMESSGTKADGGSSSVEHPNNQRRSFYDALLQLKVRVSINV